MKKNVLLTIGLFCASIVLAQDTYYWVGGTNASWSFGGNWNTVLGGGGTSRNTPNVADTLIFDGTNIGAGATGQVTVTNVQHQTISRLIFRNGADIRFTTSPITVGSGTTTVGAFVGTQPNATGQTITGSGTTFTSYFTVGDFIAYATSNTGSGGTNTIGQITAIASDVSLTQNNGVLAFPATNGSSTFYFKPVMVRIASGLTVDATSKFDMASSLPLIFKLNAAATGTINGTVVITSNFQKIVVEADGVASLTFNSGSKFQFSGTQSCAPFDAVANSSNNNVIFRAGSTFENNSTTATTTNSNGSVFGAVIPNSVIEFQKGSTFIQNSTTLSTIVSSSSRAYPNVVLNGATSGWQPLTLVDTLTVGANTNWSNSSNSIFPIKGDLIVNGTITVSGSPVFIFCGNSIQNINVTGTLATNGLARIFVGANSSVKLLSNIVQTPNTTLTNGAFIRNYGSIDFGTFTVTNAIQNQTNALQGFNPGATTISNVATTVTANSPYTFIVPSSTGVGQGMLVTGTGIPANTVVLLTAGSAPNITVTVSNPIPAGSYTVSTTVNSTGATFITANTAGIAGSFPLASGATYSLNNSNFVFNGATTTPFATGTSFTANNVTLGANVTNNITNLTLNGTLNLANNTLTVNSTDTIRIVNAANSVIGSSASRFINLSSNVGNGTMAVLRVSNINTITTLPIGSGTDYLPVTITPSASNEDYCASVFKGVTTNALVNGTAFTAFQKNNIVDAVWIINPATGFTPSGNVGIQLSWPATLEGTNFTSFTNNIIGISRYASSWENAIGSGNNTTNIANASFSTLGAFGVGQLGFSLPVQFVSIGININNNQSVLQWVVANEVNVDSYNIEASSNGTQFVNVANVKANQSSKYTLLLNNLNYSYYRIVAIDNDGSKTYSQVVTVVANNPVTSSINVFPNPITNKVLNIKMATAAGIYKVEVKDITGRTQYYSLINHNGGAMVYTLPLQANFSKGYYIIQLQNSKETIYTQKVVIQ